MWTRLDKFLAANQAEADVLARLNKLPTDGQISFEAGPHVYQLALPGDRWLPLPGSVSSLYGSFFPPFPEAAALRSVASRRGCSTEEIAKEWDAGRDDGTRFHAYVEYFYNSVEPAVPELAPRRLGAEYEQFMRFHREIVLARGWIPWRTELLLFSRKHLLAGSCDMLFVCPKTNLLVLLDWKRSKKIRREPFRRGETGLRVCADLPNCNLAKYSMQINLYRILVQWQTGRKVTRAFLACFHPNQRDYQLLEIADMRSKALQCLAIRRHNLALLHTQAVTDWLAAPPSSDQSSLQTHLDYVDLLAGRDVGQHKPDDPEWRAGWPALCQEIRDVTKVQLRPGALPLDPKLGISH